jgi:hypothetical protein
MGAFVFVRSGLSLIVFGTIFALLSYLRTQSFRQRTGINPWGIPPMVWAVASFFIAIFGTLLSIIACVTTKVPTRPRMMGTAGHPGVRGQVYAPGSEGTPKGGPPPAGMYPPAAAYPPATAYPSAADHPSASMHPASFGTGPGATPTAPPGWSADPTGRHEYRYWDGDEWTEHVSDRGVSAVDPVRAH